ncbi:MAG: hypothetical protein ACI9A2_004560 [Halioglobus sp.]|jgi:hypothetical protein
MSTSSSSVNGSVLPTRLSNSILAIIKGQKQVVGKTSEDMLAATYLVRVISPQTKNFKIAATARHSNHAVYPVFMRPWSPMPSAHACAENILHCGKW